MKSSRGRRRMMMMKRRWLVCFTPFKPGARPVNTILAFRRVMCNIFNWISPPLLNFWAVHSHPRIEMIACVRVGIPVAAFFPCVAVAFLLPSFSLSSPGLKSDPTRNYYFLRAAAPIVLDANPRCETAPRLAPSISIDKLLLLVSVKRRVFINKLLF